MLQLLGEPAEAEAESEGGGEGGGAPPTPPSQVGGTCCWVLLPCLTPLLTCPCYQQAAGQQAASPQQAAGLRWLSSAAAHELALQLGPAVAQLTSTAV